MGVVIVDTAGRSGLVVGATARGEFRCAECGYGIVVHRALPACPMCHGGDWRPWSTHRLVKSESSALTPLHV
jgi:Zn finger protein HypA/HybF involved in hydrogenase expression